MRRIKLTLDYIGTAYSGWQRQPDRDTIQKRVEDALFSLTGERAAVVASGRTDAGVHALGQVAHFDTNADIPVKNFMTGLNHFLPPDIRILKAEKAASDFHARFSAHEKTYCYCIYESKFDRAIFLNRAVRVSERLDVKAMRSASFAFKGEHDFTSFMSTGSDTVSAVRNVKDVRVVRHGGLVKIFVTANGFLYNMVRLIAGVLVRAGQGKIDGEGVEKLIALKNKHAVREVMPAEGLYLVSVKY